MRCLEIRRTESIDSKSDDDVIGNRVRVKVVKNKVAPPFRKVELNIYFGKGISRSASLLDSAVKHGLIDKRGAWFTQGDIKVGQGHENAVTFIEQNKDFGDKLERELRNMLFPGQVLKNKDGTPIAESSGEAKKGAKPADKTAAETPAGKAAVKPVSTSDTKPAAVKTGTSGAANDVKTDAAPPIPDGLF